MNRRTHRRQPIKSRVFRDSEYKSNSVIPPENVVKEMAEYERICRNAGLDLRHMQDITEQSVVPFCAFLRREGQNPIARFFEGMIDTYILVDLEKPHRSGKR